MRQILQRLCAIAAAAAVGGSMLTPALAQSGPPASQSAPPEGYAQGAAQAAGPAGASRPREMPLLYVTSIEVVRTAIKPQIEIIRVRGLASSQGWSAPQLVPFFYGKALDGVLDLQFIATSPEQSQKADGFVPIGATFTIEDGSVFSGVRVRAAANALELTKIPGAVETTIKTDSCKACIGKKFADRGRAAAGQPGVVRAEDLPRHFRVITPTHGVAGIVHNPNRLNLILDENNRIVEAFWE